MDWLERGKGFLILVILRKTAQKDYSEKTDQWTDFSKKEIKLTGHSEKWKINRLVMVGKITRLVIMGCTVVSILASPKSPTVSSMLAWLSRCFDTIYLVFNTQSEATELFTPLKISWLHKVLILSFLTPAIHLTKRLREQLVKA